MSDDAPRYGRERTPDPTSRDLRLESNDPSRRNCASAWSRKSSSRLPSAKRLPWPLSLSEALAPSLLLEQAASDIRRTILRDQW